MEFPSELRNQIEMKAATWKPSELRKASAALSEKYRNDSGKGKKLVTSGLDALVYSIVRMPATFAAVSEALRYAAECTGEEIHSLLDVGAGTGAAAWAADAVFELEKIVCLEREKAMSRLGAEYMRVGSETLKNAEWLYADLTSGNLPYQADLVTASYVLNEMSEPDRSAAVRRLWNAARKMLVITEPGTPVGFAQLKAARDQLLSEGAHIAAPCPHEVLCRLSEDDWCHFTARVQRSRLHKIVKDGDSPFEDEKFSYMVFTRNEPQRAAARVLRHPYTEKGRITLELCTASENTTVTITKKDKEIYKAAKKAVSGSKIDL